ncbi:MAG: ATP-dependent sacrificial sulfur transferase LarE [Chloroflexi bacterium]|nr:MAG: ATP-dependent sacrificial sulfur transferase LarE [Chloroflexota bacterium]
MNTELQTKYDRLCRILAQMGDVVIGMSGGVDSVLLAKVAADVLGEKAVAVTADSPSLPRRELREAQELARQIGVRHIVIKTQEVSDPRYAANPVNRCYFCKTELFTHLEKLAGELGFRWIAYGENQDDDGDHRPGRQAAGEHGVRAPLKEAGLSKADIRALAEHFNLPVWNKPAFACLGSRFPYGSRITVEKLAQVEAAEEFLWQAGFRQFRVRHHDTIARIEVAPDDMPRLLDMAPQVVAHFRQLGYTYVTLDLAGYQRGSMNQAEPALIPIVNIPAGAGRK